MLTEREQGLIEAYIPHERDKNLDEDEYYVLTANNTIQKGVVRDLAFNTRGEDLYRLWNGRGVVHCWASDNMGYVTKRHMYDNKQDCKDQTHFAYDEWEKLRELKQIQTDRRRFPAERSLYMAEKRAQDKEIKAGRNKRELAVYLDRSIVTLLGLKPGQPIVLTADKDKRQIVIQL